jgi:hypothetical protein
VGDAEAVLQGLNMILNTVQTVGLAYIAVLARRMI